MQRAQSESAASHINYHIYSRLIIRDSSVRPLYALVISYDRWFLDRIATHILAAEGDSHWTFFDGNYQEYEADKRKRLGEEGAKPKRIRYKPISR